MGAKKTNLQEIREIIVVGAGISGSVAAERAASLLGLPVRVIERRKHVGGNCWSEIDENTGVEVHRYGSHIFHTSSRKVIDYISRFTKLNSYQHHVWSRHKGRIYSMPINLATINSFYGRAFNPVQAREFLDKEIARENIAQPANLEEKAISLIGRPLYEALIRGYTMKQWNREPTSLSADIITRLPVRFSYDNRYFSDLWQGIPLEGYAALFSRLLANPLITVELGVDWFNVRQSLPADALVIYTGPIDAFFDYRLGRLEWRGLDFEWECHDLADYQGTSVINSADESEKYTRVHEFRHYHPERPDTGKTTVCREYPKQAGPGDEPYYPVDTAPNRRLYTSYRELAKSLPNVIFGGRLGTYRYLDMDDAVEDALTLAETLYQEMRG